jgi:hypothetical protein
VATNPNNLLVGDFNGDGKPDLAVTFFNGTAVSVLLNAGNGTFVGPLDSAAGGGTSGFQDAIAAGDFNGDGKLDLAVGVGAPLGAVSALLGNGNGTFAAPILYRPFTAPAGFGAAAVVAADFNGDGRPDVATGFAAHLYPSAISILINQPPVFVTGADAGGGRQVNVYDGTTGALKLSFFAYDPHFMGGVRVATGDFDLDGDQDIVTAPGPSGGPDVRVFDGTTGALIGEFAAYDPAFTGGVFVAVGDVNHDGFPDIITGTDATGGPIVQVFSGKDGSVLQTFFAYDPHFLGGVPVASADVNGDGFADVITGAGPGGGPEVRVFDGQTGQRLPGTLGGFFAYAPAFAGGVYVAAGDTNSDGYADVVTGAGAGGGPQVNVFAGPTGPRSRPSSLTRPPSRAACASASATWTATSAPTWSPPPARAAARTSRASTATRS